MNWLPLTFRRNMA